jgi:hypothetical protein
MKNVLLLKVLAIKHYEWVRENPVKRVSKGKVSNLVERWLTLEEEQKLLAPSPRWLKQIITFALNTGLRLSEILIHTYIPHLKDLRIILRTFFCIIPSMIFSPTFTRFPAAAFTPTSFSDELTHFPEDLGFLR